MPARRRSVQPIFHSLPLPHDEKVRRLARATALLALGQERRHRANLLAENLTESLVDCGEAKISLPDTQDQEPAAEKATV